MIKICLYALIASLILGCSFRHQMGNSNLKPELMDSVTKGKTTKSDLISLFGPPQTTQRNAGHMEAKDDPRALPQARATETWIYWSNNVEGSSIILPFVASTTTSSSVFTAIFYLDDDGRVIDYMISQTTL